MITTFIAGKLLPYLLAAGGAIIAFFGVYMKGRSAANKKHKADALERKIKTTERVQNAPTATDAADARKRLRNLGK
jgi:hypothetical protein